MSEKERDSKRGSRIKKVSERDKRARELEREREGINVYVFRV